MGQGVQISVWAGTHLYYNIIANRLKQSLHSGKQTSSHVQNFALCTVLEIKKKKKSIILAFKKLIIQLSKPLSLESDFKV